MKTVTLNYVDITDCSLLQAMTRLKPRNLEFWFPLPKWQLNLGLWTWSLLRPSCPMRRTARTSVLPSTRI